MECDSSSSRCPPDLLSVSEHRDMELTEDTSSSHHNIQTSGIVDLDSMEILNVSAEALLVSENQNSVASPFPSFHSSPSLTSVGGSEDDSEESSTSTHNSQLSQHHALSAWQETESQKELIPFLHRRPGHDEESATQEVPSYTKNDKHHDRSDMENKRRHSNRGIVILSRKKISLPPTVDIAVVLTYFCCTFVVSLPVVLIPTLASDIHASDDASTLGSFAAATASIATIGGGIGKLINGFVCQHFGATWSSYVYLVGMALCSLLLSRTSNHVGLCQAGLEFFGSIQWTALNTVLSNHYEKYPSKFATSVTFLSFGGTFGTLLANSLGTALLQTMHWRRVQECGVIIALVGACIAQNLLADLPPSMDIPSITSGSNSDRVKQAVSISSISASLQHVLGSRLFWTAGIAHAIAFLARYSDRLLGTYFQEVTKLPGEVCGGMTACIGFGFAHGLITGRAISHGKDPNKKVRLLAKRYARAVLSAVGLALCANASIQTYFLANKVFLVLAVCLCAGSMASSLSFQFYQLPPVVSNTFGKNKAVCLSFMDCAGYFLAAPIWGATSRIVNHSVVEPHGWSAVWGMIACLFAIGGRLMMRAIPPVLTTQASEITDKRNHTDYCKIIHLA